MNRRETLTANEMKFSRMAIDGSAGTDDNAILDLLEPKQVVRMSDKYSSLLHPLVLKLLKSGPPDLVNVKTVKRCKAQELTMACRMDGNGQPVYETVDDHSLNPESYLALLEAGWSLYRGNGKDYALVFESSEFADIRIESTKRASWGSLYASIVESEIAGAVHWSVPPVLYNHDDFVTPGTVLAKDHLGDQVAERIFGGEESVSNSAFVIGYMELVLEQDMNDFYKVISTNRWDLFTTRFWNNNIELHRLGDARAYQWVKDAIHKEAMKELEA